MTERESNHSPRLFLDGEQPFGAKIFHFDDAMTFGLRRPRDIADTTRVVDAKLDRFAAAHRFEPHLRMRPIERAFDAAQIEVYQPFRRVSIA